MVDRRRVSGRQGEISGPGRHPRGQSLVEFALVLPMLLVLLLGIADFGRVFQAGITMEAAARNGAEAAAQEYLQLVRGATLPLPTGDYQRLHDLAVESVCEEASALQNASTGTPCGMPVVAVCIHDGHDPLCAAEAGAAPTACSSIRSMSSSPANLAPDGVNGGRLPSVEVRACYQFRPLIITGVLTLPFGAGLSLGDVWLQKDRWFTVASYL
ncbi:MAG: TadE/TadG family type IV pilus assembly protein [Chloroflexota bacterium]